MNTTTTTHPSERRALRRFTGDSVSRLRLRSESGSNIVATVADLTISGIGLLATDCWPVGSRLEFQSDTALPEALTAQVRHVTALSDGTWHIGCQLSRFLRADDFTWMGGKGPTTRV